MASRFLIALERSFKQLLSRCVFLLNFYMTLFPQVVFARLRDLTFLQKKTGKARGHESLEWLSSKVTPSPVVLEQFCRQFSVVLVS